MITLYSGTPGSGKSLHIARRIYYKLKRGDIVITNIPIKLEKISKKTDKLNYIFIPNEDLTPMGLVKLSHDYFEKINKPIKEGQLFLVLDEAQLLFNSREWQHGLNRPQWLAFFSQHRKYGYEIVMIAQFDGMLDKQIRSVIEYNEIHRKASNFGIGGKLISIFGLGKLFVSVKVWYPLNEKVGSEFFRANRKYYSIYDTFANFHRQKAKSEQSKSFAQQDITEEPADLSAGDSGISA